MADRSYRMPRCTACEIAEIMEAVEKLRDQLDEVMVSRARPRTRWVSW